MKFTCSITLFLVSIGCAFCGPFAPAANQPGTTAIPKNSPQIAAWATQVLSYVPGSNVDATWQNTALALGPATGNVFDILCLGRGGQVTLTFDQAMKRREGPEFAVFENGISHTFLELAFVEVSSDGVNFFRFPVQSTTASAVGGFGALDPTNVDGFAGKYIAGFGTPFDLDALPDSPLLNRDAVRFVRLIDVVGNGLSTDAFGRPIYDPYPTFGSAGFDLDGIALLAPAPLSVETRRLSTTQFTLDCQTTIGQSYELQSAPSPAGPWTKKLEVTATATTLSFNADISTNREFFRVIQR